MPSNHKTVPQGKIKRNGGGYAMHRDNDILAKCAFCAQVSWCFRSAKPNSGAICVDCVKAATRLLRSDYL